MTVTSGWNERQRQRIMVAAQVCASFLRSSTWARENASGYHYCCYEVPTDVGLCVGRLGASCLVDLSFTSQLFRLVHRVGVDGCPRSSCCFEDQGTIYLARCIGGQRKQHYIEDKNVRNHFATTGVKILPPQNPIPSVIIQQTTGEQFQIGITHYS